MAGKGRAVELSHRADDTVDLLGRVGAVVRPHGQRPPPRGVVEAGLGHLAAETDALAEVQLLGRRLQVGQQVGLGREAGDPVVGLGEREAVELVGHVDPAARVDVLQPGAAHVGVLLEHGDLHPGLAQAVRGRQARGARPDDRAPERAADVGQTPRRFPRVGPLEGELLGQEALPVLGRRRRRRGTRRSAATRPAPGCGRAGPRPGGPTAPRRRARAPRPPARAPGRARARAAAPGRERSPHAGATGRRSGAPPRTGAGARPPRRRPPSVVPRRRPLRTHRPHPCGRAYAGPTRPAGRADGRVRRAVSAPCACRARRSGCSPRPCGAACPWPSPGSRPSSGRPCPRSRRWTSRRRSRPTRRTR